MVERTRGGWRVGVCCEENVGKEGEVGVSGLRAEKC